MNIGTIINFGKYSLRGKKANDYVNKRYAELITKNYTPVQAQEMLYFELGLKTTAEISLKNASKGACFSAGADIGAGVGATVGSAVPVVGTGAGAFAGAGAGGAAGIYVCGKGIDYATEKASQSLSEHIWTTSKNPTQAYIKSQQHEGWTLIEKQYNDGGFSGGTLERPALKKLLTDIEAGKVDIVVVYKVDRLTRSLMDFSKIVERFDRHETSFVSITQHFNTTSSMGRLTLNILLSFAQFEREVTGERIRDKMLASKKKGMWMNGVAPLGYLNKDRTLEIDEENADKIKLIFDKYLELESVHALKTCLEVKKITTKTGKNFAKGHLYKILENKTYIGKIEHKGKVYDGLHDAIIDEDIFEKVQKILTTNRMKQRSSADKENPSLLAGKLFDDKNNYMSPSHSNTRNRKYRYYISQAIIQHRRQDAGKISKIPAGEIEKVVTQKIKNFVSDANNTQPMLKETNIDKQKALLKNISDKINNQFIRTILSKVVIYKEKIEIIICKNQLLKTLEAVAYNTDFPEELKDETKSPIILTKNIKITATANNGSVLILTDTEVQQPEINPILVKAVAKSYLWNKQILSGEVKNGAEIQKRENLKSYGYVANILDLRFLAADITEAILNGTQPRDLTLNDLFKVKTLNWEEQKSQLKL